MDLSRLGWIDLAIIVVLAAGVFLGYLQGIIRTVLNCLGVLVAFAVAAQLKRPLLELMSVWTAFTPEIRELILFLILFFGLVIGFWFLIRAFYARTRLPIVKQLDEIGGAIFGALFVALLITFHLVVLDSIFRGVPPDEMPNVGFLNGYWQAMNDSLLVGIFRDTLIPTAGYLVRPFVPREVAALLER